jgi:hypothetical protein
MLLPEYLLHAYVHDEFTDVISITEPREKFPVQWLVTYQYLCGDF